MNVILIGLLAAATFIVWMMVKRARGNDSPVVAVKSTIDGRTYYVQDKQDKQNAADMLAQIRAKMIALVSCVRTNVASSEAPDAKEYGSYQSRLDRLVSRFNADRIAEGNEDLRYTTYTLNKGEKMVFCLRARDASDNVHDLAMMTFVAIHEMAHVTSISNHHTPEFHANFKWLLQNAVKCGIYHPEDFKKSPRKYCGINVSDNPVID